MADATTKWDQDRLRAYFDALYHGPRGSARRFRYVLLSIDVLTLAFFVIAPMLPQGPYIFAIDTVIAFYIALEWGLRLWITPHKRRFLIDPINLADILVVITLLVPALVENFAFLRVIRALRILRSYHVLRELRQTSVFYRRNEEIITAVINLIVFIFVMTALVYVFQVRTNDAIANYVDALYFTITTLTTTGFGDITLQGTSGRLLAIVIMVFGISLFLRLIQTVFRPNKVSYECPDCGLNRHDADAVHCKHCGRVIHIETEGA
jgi:voltage-gated potassium channel